MAIRKVGVDVIFPVGHEDWTVDSVKWALCSVASQDCDRWRLRMIDATRTTQVRDLAEGIIPAEKLAYSKSFRKGAPTLAGLLYEAMLGAKAKYIAYIVPGTCWYPNHLSRLLHEMNEGADVAFMSRQKAKHSNPEKMAICPGVAKIWGIMHRMAHYERTPGFHPHSDDPALDLMRGFHDLLTTAWHPVVAQIRAPEVPALPPESSIPLVNLKVTQLSLFAHV